MSDKIFETNLLYGNPLAFTEGEYISILEVCWQAFFNTHSTKRWIAHDHISEAEIQRLRGKFDAEFDMALFRYNLHDSRDLLALRQYAQKGRMTMDARKALADAVARRVAKPNTDGQINQNDDTT